MRHNRAEVIKRTKREFKLLDDLVAELTNKDWGKYLIRPETKDPWTVKDALVHITHWMANTARSIRGQRRPPEERGMESNAINHLVYVRWRDRSPLEVLKWHKQVQADVLAALKEAPEEWFSGKEHNPEWPYDIDGHSTYHRVKDIERALAKDKG
jgi:hypothetical protein